MLASACLGVVLSILFSFLAAPSLAQMYADFGGELPFLTRLALSRPHIGGLLFLDTALLIGGVSLAVTARQRAGRGLLLGAVVLAIAIVTVLLVGTYLPIFQLAGAIQE